ncbi:MAG TPA: hypothetical protein VF933_25755 [Streptosporangiaceae bacterium]
MSEISIHPWTGADGRDSADLLRRFAASHAHPLSPRLAADLKRDAGELGRLRDRDQHIYHAELARLVRRHIRADTAAGGTVLAGGRAAANQAADALAWLGGNEHAPAGSDDTHPGPLPAARVGIFLRQEAR